MRSSEPGFEAIAVPDGRRGLWARARRERDEIAEVEIVAGREGDDDAAALRAGEVVTPDALADLWGALLSLRFAGEVASGDALSRLGARERTAARAAGQEAVVRALEVAEAGIAALRTETADLRARVRRLAFRAGESGRPACPACLPGGCAAGGRFGMDEGAAEALTAPRTKLGTPCEHRGQWYGDREYGTTFCSTCHADITARVDALIERDKAFCDERGYIVGASKAVAGGEGGKTSPRAVEGREGVRGDAAGPGGSTASPGTVAPSWGIPCPVCGNPRSARVLSACDDCRDAARDTRPDIGEASESGRPVRIYVASSWRCARQPEVVQALRAAGHEVYDFRNPAPGDQGFSWRQIDEDRSWLTDPARFRHGLKHPIAQHGFSLDMNALRACDVCVVVLPCGRSAHLELGWAAGAGKRTIVLLDDPMSEPELMYLACSSICVSLAEVVEELKRPARAPDTWTRILTPEGAAMLREPRPEGPAPWPEIGWRTLAGLEVLYLEFDDLPSERRAIIEAVHGELAAALCEAPSRDAEIARLTGERDAARSEAQASGERLAEERARRVAEGRTLGRAFKFWMEWEPKEDMDAEAAAGQALVADFLALGYIDARGVPTDAGRALREMADAS